MHVRFLNEALRSVSEHESKYVSPSQLCLSSAVEYEVHAVSVYDGISFVLVIDDDATPTFLPRALFETTSSLIPHDWICNLFPIDPVQLVMGPSFIASSLTSYNAMVDQEWSQVQSLWQRVSDEREGNDCPTEEG